MSGCKLLSKLRPSNAIAVVSVGHITPNSLPTTTRGTLQAWIILSVSDKSLLFHSWRLCSVVSLCESIDCNLPGSSVHEISQARILEWVAILTSRLLPTQGSNLGLLHCRQILYPLSHLGSHIKYNIVQDSSICHLTCDRGRLCGNSIKNKPYMAPWAGKNEKAGFKLYCLWITSTVSVIPPKKLDKISMYQVDISIPYIVS